MFGGLSVSDRSRLDTAAQNASTALTKIEGHEIRCTERYEEIRRTMQEYSADRKREAIESRAQRNRTFWMLVTVVVGVLSLIVKELVIRGLHP